jgi:hypothetical protein
MSMLRTALAGSIALCLTATSACNKGAEEAPNTQTSPGSVATPSAVTVSAVTLGRSIGADKRVAEPMETFRPDDTIYASVRTAGAASTATLTARWTFEDGQVVSEGSETIAPTGPADTEFHISKPGGWPKGKYTLHVRLNGAEVQTKTFEVK